MNPQSFAVTVESTLDDLQNRIEADAPEVECDLVDSVLILLLPDDSQIIVNRQEAAQQIWLACSDGPARFSWQGDAWQDSRTGESLKQAVARLLSLRLGHPVSLG
ncbi:iron donor protein CyaY [Acidithiobacillus ferridurans]|uniref:iron donor protein CyaY n=1 Tax=Acidithiobacillus ferridurans TaxID=1232575 RepID=UPI001C07C892|nr:iron donor protein CyaY [Acidithiobacillus ferridurans]MBU2804940.1 iron donor protein CyaY [Acidithiobacillus ferridurans]